MLLAAVFAFAVLTACDERDDSAVYRDLLIEALWCHDVEAPGDGPDKYYYNFRDSGVVSVFPVRSGNISEGTDYKYIYDADNGRIAIETFGMYTVREINTARLVLANSAGETVLDRSRESVTLPDSAPDNNDNE